MMNSEMKEKTERQEGSLERPAFIPKFKVNAAIRALGVKEGRAMYFRKKYSNGEAHTIDEWKQIMK